MSSLDWFKKERPLLGLLGMGGGGAGEAKAFEVSGGTKHTTPTHYVHTFAGSGALTVSNQDLLPSPITFDIVLIGGGGGGGQDRYPDHRGAGGGGAGRLYPVNSITLADGEHPIAVGVWGNGAGSVTPAQLSSPYGGPGGNTVFVASPTSTYTSGGGAGGGNHGGPSDPMGNVNSVGGSAGPHGGSGGGGANSRSGGSGGSGGNPGGTGGSYPYGSGGGGGGAGGTGGSSPDNNTGGVGGNGSPVPWITAPISASGLDVHCGGGGGKGTGAPHPRGGAGGPGGGGGGAGAPIGAISWNNGTDGPIQGTDGSGSGGGAARQAGMPWSYPEPSRMLGGGAGRGGRGAAYVRYPV